MWVGVVFDLNDHTDTLFGGFITDVADADDDFFVHQISDLNKHVCLLDLVWNLVDDDALSLVVIIDIALGTNVETTLTGCVHVNDTIDAMNVMHAMDVMSTMDVMHAMAAMDAVDTMDTMHAIDVMDTMDIMHAMDAIMTEIHG